MADGIAVEIVGLLASPAHRYDGRPSDGARPVPAGELHDEIEVRAGSGIVGDRYATRRDPSVTLQSVEALEAVATELGVAVPSLDETRRNVLLRGVDVDALARTDFSLDAGSGEVLFTRTRPANPCAWMTVEIAPGAARAFRGRGGLRALPATSGTLRLGPAILRVLPAPPVE